LASDCTAAFTTTNGQIIKDGSDSIVVKRDVSAGYGPVSICYKCQSDQTAGFGTNTGNMKTFAISI